MNTPWSWVEEDLLELNEALHQMNGKIVRMALRNFTIWPT
jgi:hypothetical protein